MSAFPIGFNSSPLRSISRPRSLSLRKHWFPVLCALIFICFTSTTLMDGHNTGMVVATVWKTFFGTSKLKVAWQINFFGRKVGHFFGYGIVGLIFRNAWYKTANSFSLVAKTWLIPFTAFLAVVSTFTAASLDEYHQMFVPGRVGCLHDALLDTAGAIFLNLIVSARLMHKLRDKQDGEVSLKHLRVQPARVRLHA